VRAVERELAVSTSPEVLQSRLRVNITCDEQSVSIEVEDHITGKTLKRTEARPSSRSTHLEERLLVLSIVELIIASWAELLLHRVEPNEPIPTPSSVPVQERPAAGASPDPRMAADRRAAAETARLRLVAKRTVRRRLIAGVASRVELESSRFEYGASLRYREAHGVLGFSVDFGELHGRERVSLGQVDIDLLALGAAVELGHAWSRVQTRLGFGARGGVAVLAGHSTDPGFVGVVHRAPFVDVFGAASVDVALSRRWCIDISAEAGYNVLPVIGLVESAREVAIRGPWVGAQIGLGLLL
jgi:hypothetical protein